MKKMYLQTAYVFPYAKVPAGTEIVIYGAGQLGTIYINQLLATNYAEIKYVVDKNYKQLKGKLGDLDIRSPKSLDNETKPIIVVAVANGYYREEIVNELLSYNINRERIIDDICQYHWETNKMNKICRTLCTAEEYNELVSDSQGVERLQTIEKLLGIKKVFGTEVKRIGRIGDGGYIMLEDFLDGNIAYSFGISNEISWDEDIASHGYEVFMYDHTISNLPRESEKLHWFPIGIIGKNKDNTNLMSLDEILKKNGHAEENNMILKMDVEGAEWDVLKEISSDILIRFDQMVFEFHDVYNRENYDLIRYCLEKLNKTHQAIHIHPNNYGNCVWVDGKAYPDALEVSYVKKGKYQFDNAVKIALPISEDSPNCACIPEIELRDWNKFI